MTTKREFHARTERIEDLVNRLERTSDPELHAIALELMQSVMELHGVALERMMEILSRNTEGERAIGKFLEDDLVASVLLLHGLHPEDLETRVHRALEKARPLVQSHGGDVALLSVTEGVVRLRIHHAGGGCGSTLTTIKNAVEDAVTENAPDAVQIISETVQQPNASQLVTIT